MKNEFEVPIRCLFCRQPLQVERDREYSSGDFLECALCGESNDFDAVLEVATEEGVDLVRREVKDEIENQFRRAFKGFK